MSRPRQTLTTRGRALLACGVTLVLAGGLLGFPDLTRVGVLLLGLPLVSLLLGRRAPELTVHRTVSPVPVSVGETATVRLRATNSGARGTGLLLAQEGLPPELGLGHRFVLGVLARGAARTMTYAVRPQLRGHHRLGPLAVQVRDPFGLTGRHVEMGGRGELVVLPRTVPLGAGRPPGTGIGSEGEIPHLVALHGEDDQSIREYRDGDDLRRIHWPATARAGELMVRQEDRPARRRAVVLLDSRSQAHRGQGLDSSFEWAVSAVASVVVHLISRRYAVHLVTQETLVQGCADTAIEPMAALEVLADARLGSGVGFAQTTQAAQALAAGGGLLVAVLADHDEQALRELAGIRVPGGTALAIVVDTGSLDGGRRGLGPGRPVSGDPVSGGPVSGGPVSGGPGQAGPGTDALRGAGWATTVVTTASTVDAAWSQVAGSARWHQAAGAALAGARR